VAVVWHAVGGAVQTEIGVVTAGQHAAYNVGAVGVVGR